MRSLQQHQANYSAPKHAAKIVWTSDIVQAALALLVAIVLLYAPVVFLGRSLQAPLYYPAGMVDSGAYGNEGRKPVNVFDMDLATPAYYEWPINLLVGKAYRQGEFPLWNPYQAAGTPLAAQYSTRAFFPYQVLLDLSPVSTWDFFFLGRLWIAGFFTFLFLRGVGVSWTSGILGALIYMFSGSFVWFINLEEFVNTAMVAPVLLWSVAGFWRWGWQRGSVATAVAIALTLLAGQPEIALYVSILGASYCVFRLGISGPRERTRLLCAGLVSMILGLFLASPLLLPFREFQQRSFNLHPPGGTMGVQDPARPLDALSILVPSFYQRETFVRFFPDNGRWDWLGGYLGTIPVYLILLGLVLAFVQKHSRWRGSLLFFALFGALVVLKNFGFPLVAWVGRLPMLDQAWSPRWAGPSWTLSFAIAAALGLECLRDQAQGGESPWWVPRWKATVSRWIRDDIFRLFRQPLYYVGIPIFIAVGALVGIPWTYEQIARSEGIAGEVFRSRYFFSSVVLGTVVAIVMLLGSALLTRAYLLGRTSMNAFLGLVLLELWYAIPWGYQPGTAALRFFVVLAGLGAILGFTRHQFRWTAFGMLVALTLALGIDGTARQGLPQRYDAGTPPPFVRFLKAQGDFYRVTGGDGVLMPNFASAVGLLDVRYINSLIGELYERYRSQNLHTNELWRPGGNTLWFTGGSQLEANRGGRPLRVPVDFGDDFRANLPYYSLLGVKYIIMPKTYEWTSVVGVKNLLFNGDLSKWSRGGGPFHRKGETWADGWDIDLYGNSKIDVSRGSAILHGHAHDTGRIIYSQDLHDRPGYVRVPISDFTRLLGTTITFSMKVKANAAEAVRLGISGVGTSTSWSEDHFGDGKWETLVVSHHLPSKGVKALVVLVELRKSASVEVGDAWLIPGRAPSPASRFGYYIPAEFRNPTTGMGRSVIDFNLLANGGLEAWSHGAGPFVYRPSESMRQDDHKWADDWAVESAEGVVLRIVRDEMQTDGNSQYSARVAQVGWGQSRLVQRVEIASQPDALVAAFSLRVKTGISKGVRIGIALRSHDVAWSDYHPGDGNWHTLTVTLPASTAVPSSLQALAELRGTVQANIANAMLVPQAQALRFIPISFFRKVYDREVKIYENRDVLPRVFVVHRATSHATLADAQSALRDPRFDFRHVAVLEEPTPPWYHALASRTASFSRGSSYASVASYGLNDVTVIAESPGEGILVLTDVFAPGWTASIDGHPTEVILVDGLFRGVHLPAGKHLVVFRYAPRSFALGLLLASMAALSCFVLIAFSFRRLGGETG